MDAAAAVVEELLQQAGQFRGDLHQVGELVEDQAGAGFGAGVQGPEQGRPGRVLDLGEARNAPGGFPGKSMELQRCLAQVRGVVDVARAHHLLQKRRLAATAPAEDHDESRLIGSENPGQSVDFPCSVQKLEAHGTELLCGLNIMLKQHNNFPQIATSRPDRQAERAVKGRSRRSVRAPGSPSATRAYAACPPAAWLGWIFFNSGASDCMAW